MMTMPAMMLVLVTLLLGSYLSAVGTSSLMLMYVCTLLCAHLTAQQPRLASHCPHRCMWPHSTETRQQQARAACEQTSTPRQVQERDMRGGTSDTAQSSRGSHHHAGDDRKEDAVRELRHAVAVEDEVAEQATERLGEARYEGPHEALPARAGRVVHGHGDAHALGDVVQRDGDGDGDAVEGVGEGGDERGETLRKVVDADGERGHDAHLLQAEAVVVVGEHHVDGVRGVGGELRRAVGEVHLSVLHAQSD